MKQLEVKISKIQTQPRNCCNYLKTFNNGFTIKSPKDAVRIANSLDLDQQTDLGLYCLPRPVCPKIYEHYGSFICMTGDKLN